MGNFLNRMRDTDAFYRQRIQDAPRESMRSDYADHVFGRDNTAQETPPIEETINEGVEGSAPESSDTVVTPESNNVEKYVAEGISKGYSTDDMLARAGGAGISTHELLTELTKDKYKGDANEPTRPDTSMGRFREMEAQMREPSAVLQDTKADRFVARMNSRLAEANKPMPERPQEVPEGDSKMLPRAYHSSLGNYFSRGDVRRPLASVQSANAPMMGRQPIGVNPLIESPLARTGAAPMMGLPQADPQRSLADAMSRPSMPSAMVEPGTFSLSIDRPYRPNFIRRGRRVR